MKVTVDATPQELADEGEIIRAHLEELLTGSLTLSKGGLATIKAHPVTAVNEMTESWLRAYREAMAIMNDDVEKLLITFLTPQEVSNGST